MKRVYSANTLLEAQLAADVLAQLGIPSHIFNANAAGAVGELPFTQVLPEVWIDDETQIGLARTALAELDRCSSGAEKPCPTCGELNPGNFLSCWKCGQALAE